jgi:hypothetical protein
LIPQDNDTESDHVGGTKSGAFLVLVLALCTGVDNHFSKASNLFLASASASILALAFSHSISISSFFLQNSSSAFFRLVAVSIALPSNHINCSCSF